MRSSALIPLAAALWMGCTTDNDQDGFNVDEDCDDTNALIYPGAVETVGDGVDSDCDGDDPQHPFVGDWDLTDLTVTSDMGELFEGYASSGTLTVALDLTSSVNIIITDDQDVMTLDLTGTATANATEGEFSLDLVGKADGYAATAQWDCATTAPTVQCDGPLVVDGQPLNGSASFTAL